MRTFFCAYITLKQDKIKKAVLVSISLRQSRKGKLIMNVSIIMKIAGVGILVSVANNILSKSGRDEQAVFCTIAGVIIVLLMLVGEIDRLFSSVRTIFGL